MRDGTASVRLTDGAIEEYRALWEQEFGETITKEYAAVRAREIVTLYEKLYVSGAGLKEGVPEGKEAGRETFHDGSDAVECGPQIIRWR